MNRQEKELISSLQAENHNNQARLRRLRDKSRQKSYYIERKNLFEVNQYKGRARTPEKRPKQNVRKRMTMYTIKRKKSLRDIRKLIKSEREMTFQPRINETSRRLVGDLAPFKDRSDIVY